VAPRQGLLGLRTDSRLRQPSAGAAWRNFDLSVVRELIGGLVFGARGVRDDGTVFDTCSTTLRRSSGLPLALQLAARHRLADLRLQCERARHFEALASALVSELAAEYPELTGATRAYDIFAMGDRDGARDDRRRRHREHVLPTSSRIWRPL